MKRVGYLIDDIVDMNNLYLAYYKAKRRKNYNNAIHEYEKNLQENLIVLKNEILSGKLKTGSYNYFKIYDPKERIICAAPFEQRVMHHALMNVCHTYFEKKQIFDSYACRIGKGTYSALERAKQFTVSNEYFLKLDYRKYFDSLSHEVLKNQLNKIFKDKKLLTLFYKIIDSYSTQKGKGVPIGNLTSQYMANNYLSELDHIIKEKLKIKNYIRYMDDSYLWNNDKNILINAYKEIEKFSKEKLLLDFKPYCINKCHHGVPALGYVIFPEKIYLSQRSKKRFVKKLLQYEENLQYGLINQEQYKNCVEPLVAFTEYANGKNFRKNIIKKYKI